MEGGHRALPQGNTGRVHRRRGLAMCWLRIDGNAPYGLVKKRGCDPSWYPGCIRKEAVHRDEIQECNPRSSCTLFLGSNPREPLTRQFHESWLFFNPDERT